MKVYVDLIFLLNVLVDFLLLLGTNRLSGFPTDWKRIIAASLLGGIYGSICLVPPFWFLANTLWRLVFLALIAVTAFGWNRSVWKRSGVFVLLTMALGGLAVSIGHGGIPSLILSAAVILFLCRVAFGNRIGEREYVPLTITYGNNTVDLIALRDSGNTLRDPITGEQVLVISGWAAEKLTGLNQEQLRTPLETLGQRPVVGLRLIPYHAVGNGGSMLLAMRFENVKVGSRQQSAIVAFAPEGLGRGEMVQALTGGAI